MNNNSNLAPFIKDGLELIIDLATGASYAPGYNALARICSVGLGKPITAEQVKRYVSSLFKAVTLLPLLKAEVDTSQGLRTITLIPENLMAKTIRKFNEFLAEKIDEAGMRVFAHKLAGYQISSVQPKSKTQAEALLESVQMLVDYERRLMDTEQRIDALEQQRKHAIDNLNDLPLAMTEIPEFTTQFALNRLVRGFAIANHLDVSGCYTRLHTEFRDRYHIDLVARGRNHKPKLSGVQFAEDHWLIEHLYAVALKLFGKSVVDLQLLTRSKI